jgi:hypothetical protein
MKENKMNKQQYRIFLLNFYKDSIYHKIKLVETNKILRLQVMRALLGIITVVFATAMLNDSVNSLWGGIGANLIIFSGVFYTYKQNEKERNIFRQTRKGLYFSNRIRYILRKEHKLHVFNSESLLKDFKEHIFDKFTIQENYNFFYKDNKNKELKKYTLYYIVKNEEKITHSDIVFLERENDVDFKSFVEKISKLKKSKLKKSINEF